MNNCPFCSGQMLRHISNRRIFWYCPSCHQEVPNLQSLIQGLSVERSRPVGRN
ncbi:hypothetical protein [Oscillatoria sp. FACHB-1406]|uniref:hypothetical protein n=1 Tax=Oscillatoria sp. FACHB-1406 TaxID=2692846 RepID=UPI00168597E3|nr:hypothetical protein [Oscillatoria sp. FACHB-1406]MBD2580659.1 hypothetical protein [Oscillatoria sp. FACHB-1406]